MNFSAFIKEVLKGKTLFRALLFGGLIKLLEKESSLNQHAKVLELGSEPASHQRALPRSWQLTTSNFNKNFKVDLVLDAEQKFELSDNSYDGVVIFNTLYLINNYRQCLTESLRVSGQFVIFNIPVVAALAPQPTDYNRFTADRLKEIMSDLSQAWPSLTYQIIPLGGSFTSAVNAIDVYLKFRIVRLPLYLLALALDKLDNLINRRCPVQYLVLIKKS